MATEGLKDTEKVSKKDKKLKKLKRKAAEATEANYQDEDPLNVDTSPGEVKKKRKNPNDENNKKSNKKNKVKKTKKKRSKSGDADEESSGASDNEAADEAVLPNNEMLKEAEAIQNSTASLTIRQKKKKKHEKLMEEKKVQNVDKEKQRNEEYLTKWKNSKQDWKFEKLRQISIQNSIFEAEKISEEVWPIALEYLSGSKGAAKKIIGDLAKDVLTKLDEQCAALSDEDEQQSVVNSIKYQRARDLLQNLD